jgi:hypothetical protein
MTINWHGRLKEIAHAENMSGTSEELRAIRQRLYEASGLQQLDEMIEVLETRPQHLRRSLQSDALEHCLKTGETELHNLIEFRRTQKPEYDNTEALVWCMEHAPDFVIVTEKLDKRKFNSAARHGLIDWPGVSIVETPTIAIKKVGHLLEDNDNDQ